jgi:hypothetical protein
VTEEAIPNVELLLRQALAPVDPPADFAGRLERALTNLSELAAGELESWELRAMRDPRNWVRPAAALVVSTTAGAALVVLRARQRRQSEPPRTLGGLGAAREAAGAAREAGSWALQGARAQARRPFSRG